MRSPLHVPLVLAGAALALLHAAPARATVCPTPIEHILAVPSAITHAASLGIVTTGVIASGAAPGWRRAGVITAIANMSQTATVLAVDALSEGDVCASNPTRFEPVTLGIEGAAFAASTGLLLTALLWPEERPPPVSFQVAPTRTGFVAGAGFTF